LHFLEYFGYCTSVYGVKCLIKIYEDIVQLNIVLVIFLIFFT